MTRRAWLAMAMVAMMATMVGRARADRRPGHVAFRAFAAEDGLANLVVLAIAEDRRGALWIGTDDGLYRIDGERAVRVAAGAELDEQHIPAIAEAPDGGICVPSERSLMCSEPGGNTGFRRVPGVDGVHALAGSPEALWFVTARGLWVRRRAGPAMPVDTGLGDGPPLLWADAAGAVGYRAAALAASRPDGGWTRRAIELEATEAGATDEPRELMRDAEGTVWLRADRHVWRLAAGEHRARDITHGLALAGDGWPGRMMTIAPDGALVIATPAGIATLRGERWDVLGQARGLPTPGARLAYYDHAGDLWVGSIGVLRQLGRGIIERYTQTTAQLPGDAAWSVMRTRDGELLVGTNQCLAHLHASAWACIAGTEGRVVRAIVEMSDGTLYFGGAPPVLLRRNTNGTVEEVARLTASRQVPRILSLARDDDDTLWIATDAGLWRRARGEASPTLPVLPTGGDPHRFISTVIADGPRLWFAGHEGLRVLEGGSWIRLTAADGLRATEVRYLARRRDGRLCAIYDQGLGVTCFRYRDGRLLELHHIGADDGLDVLMAYSLGEDLDGRLWLGTGSGLRVLPEPPAPAATPVDRFTTRDGISGDDATAMAFWRDDDGGLWFGSSSGLTHVAADRYRGVPAPPQVRLLAFEASADHAHARFIATELVEADVEYQVRLPPSDPGWTPTGREVRFSGLPPGDYRLELRARRRGGAWGPATTAPFAVPAAWWQTRTARITGGAALLLIAWLAALGWQRASLRRRTRSLRAQTDASFRMFVASMPDAVVVRRADGETYLNQPARDLLGPAVGAWLLRRIHPDDRRRASALTRRRTPSSRGELVELRVGDPGGWRHLEVALHTIELAGALAHVVVGRDVTERRRLHARMAVADRMVSLGTLAAGMGHEINNPLASVRANLEHLGELAASDQLSRREVDVAVREALDGADRVRMIVRGLAHFQPAAREQRIAVDLADVIAQAVRLTHNELRHRAQLELTGAPPPRVLGDPGRLIQVVVNLLINAAHACPPGAADRYQITVRTGRDADGQATLEIEDRGVGMAPDVVARVFDPFFTTKQIGEGTGLGLSICHGIITGLGGQITLDSQLGRGTTIRIALPAAPAAPPSAPPRAPSATRPRVLVVDDEPAVGDGMGRMLRRSCEVTVLTDSEEAVRRIAGGERYDVIVSDVMMPVMTGLELYDQLRAIDPSLAHRIVFVTGGAFNPATAERLDQLDAPRLLKPFTGDELRDLVRTVSEAAPATAGDVIVAR